MTRPFDVIPQKKTIHNELLCEPCEKGRTHWGDCNYGVKDADWNFSREWTLKVREQYL